MYSVFDPFLHRETWYKSHPNDDQVFYLCLSKVVTSPDFNPEAMRDYFIAKVGTGFSSRIEQLTTVAWGIREYLQAIG